MSGLPLLRALWMIFSGYLATPLFVHQRVYEVLYEEGKLRKWNVMTQRPFTDDVKIIVKRLRRVRFTILLEYVAFITIILVPVWYFWTPMPDWRIIACSYVLILFNRTMPFCDWPPFSLVRRIFSRMTKETDEQRILLEYWLCIIFWVIALSRLLGPLRVLLDR